MTKRTVLVLTAVDDPTSDHVITQLNQRNISVVRLDPADLSTGKARLTAFYGTGGPAGVLETSSRTLDLGSVGSLYYRRPSEYTAPETMDAQDARFSVAQARQGFGGALASLDCRYVNHPWNIMRNDHKPAQLAAAIRFGFQVLPTIVTNDLTQARSFAIEHGPVVYKPLRVTSFRNVEGHAVTVWVEVIDPDELDDRIGLTAHMFQTASPGKIADIRITAIGDDLFGVRIDSPHLDFRRDYSKVTYSVFDIPQKIAESCRAYLANFGLLFGAFDFGLTADGSLHWYELNSAGQWLWLEEQTGLPMTKSLVDLLERTP